MLSLLLQRGTLRASPAWLPSRTGASAAAARRAVLARVALDARRTFLTSPLSLAASKPAETTATGAKKRASKSTTKATGAGTAKPRKSASATGTKQPKAKATKPKKTKPKKEEPPKKLRPSERPPKRFPGPWNLFLVKYRLDNNVKNANAAEAQETMKVASAAWRSLSDAEKKPYYDQSAAGKAEREKQRAEYYANMSDEIMARLNIQRKKNGETAVVRRHSLRTTGVPGPRNSYALFVSDYFRNHPTDTAPRDLAFAANRDLVRQAAGVWKGMSESERAPFVELARKDLERYRQEIAVSG